MKYKLFAHFCVTLFNSGSLKCKFKLTSVQKAPQEIQQLLDMYVLMFIANLNNYFLLYCLPFYNKYCISRNFQGRRKEEVWVFYFYVRLDVTNASVDSISKYEILLHPNKVHDEVVK